MISDSIPWRDELLRVADRLEKKGAQRRWTERSSFIVERDVMTSAYAIRRLLEAGKVSRSTAATPVTVTEHASTGERVDGWNRHEIWELYDLEVGVRAQLGLRRYCNQLIHSYVWSLNAGKETELFDGVFAASENECQDRLFFIPLKSMIEVCRRIGSEDIYGSGLLRDRAGAGYWISYTREDAEREGWGSYWSPA